MTTEGRKDDAQKARYDLLPPELMDGTARVLYGLLLIGHGFGG